MAWLDDRFWAHPKVAGLSDRAYRVFVNSICYASGMSTHGHLDEAQIRLIGAKNREKNELISRKLWVKNGENVRIHDWEEHNDKRDERRAADRERKRLARAKEREKRGAASAGQGADSPPDNPQDSSEGVRRTEAGRNVGPARAEEVKSEEVKEEQLQGQEPKQQQVQEEVAVDAARANNRKEGEPAAARATPPTQPEIEAALATLTSTDHGSFARIAPLADQLPHDVFAAVLQRVHDSRNAGKVKNDVGLLHSLLETAVSTRHHDALSERASDLANRTPEQEIVAAAERYARNEQPWDAAEELLQRRIARLADTADDEVALLELAQETYDATAHPEPTVGKTPA